MKAINRYIIVDRIKTEPKKVAGLIMTDDDGKLSKYERKRGTAIAKSMAKNMNGGGSVMMQGRGCGAIMADKQKMTRVPRG